MCLGKSIMLSDTVSCVPIKKNHSEWDHNMGSRVGIFVVAGRTDETAFVSDESIC